MRLVFLMLFFHVALDNLNCQNFSWAKKMGGNSQDNGLSIALDSAQNVYTTGSFAGSNADFDPGPGTYTLSTFAGGQPDIFISKLDKLGDFIWARQMGGGGIDGGNEITVDISGNVYSTGFFAGSADFDPSISTYNIISAGGQDVYVSKLDIYGNFVWAKGFGGIGNDVGNSIAVDSIGNVYVAGIFSNTVDFDPGPSSYTLTSAGNSDIFVVKFDVNGNFIWAKQIGNANSDDIQSITTTTSSIYFTGSFSSVVDFNPNIGIDTLTSFGGTDIFICKWDLNGNFIWARKLGGIGSNEKGYGVRVDNKGNVLTTGTFSLTADFDPSLTNFTITSLGNTDAFISKLDSNGNFIWAKNFSGAGAEFSNAIAIDKNNDIIIGGQFTSTGADFDPGPATYTLSATLGTYDLFTCKVNSLGNFVWAIRIGGGNTDLTNSVVVDKNDEVYTVGYFSVTVDFDPGPGLFALNASTGDIYVNKLSSCSIPPPPTNATNAINLQPCSGKTTTLSVIATGTPYWYATSTSTNVINTGSVYITPVLSAGTYTYYVENVTCTTSMAKTAITVTVGATPTLSVFSSTTTVCNGQPIIFSVTGANTYTWITGSTSNSITVTPSITTTYSVVGTSTNGCVNSANITTSVNPLPLVSASSPSLACENSTICLNASGALTYQWIGPCGFNSILQSPCIPVNLGCGCSYLVLGTDSNGCSNLANICFTVVPSPSVSITSTSSLICSGQTVTLTANGAVSYTWNTTSINDTIVVTPFSTFTYTVVGTGTNNCNNAASFTQNVSACTIINETFNDSELLIYPNPTSRVVTISAKTGMKIYVYNMIGELIQYLESTTNIAELDFSNYSNGIYIIRIGSVMKKIIKE